MSLPSLRHPLCLALLGLLAAPVAHAGPADKVYAPIVEQGETELEFRGGYRDFDGAPSEHAFVFDVGYGVTSRWKTELVLEYAAEDGNPGTLEAWEWENIFVLTEQGKHWVDVGVFFEYENVFAAGPDEVKIGPMFQKEIGPTVANLNLLFEREVGDDASDETELAYSWQVKWRGKESLEWGLQGFGGLGEIDHLGEEDEHILGPALFGVKRLASGNKFAYNGAVLAGLNAAAPDVTVRFELEYEIY
jgi:hypothetical protein